MKQRSDRPFRPTPRHLRHFLVLLAKNSGLRASGSSPLQTSTPINSNSSDKSAAALNDLFGPCSTNPYSMHIIKQMPKLLARAIDETDDMELLSINELYNFNRVRVVITIFGKFHQSRYSGTRIVGEKVC
jgi:hypothetical protein